MIHKKKERIELSNFMKIIYSCSVKDTIKGMKRQITEWEKKFIYSTMDLYLEYINEFEKTCPRKNDYVV